MTHFKKSVFESQILDAQMLGMGVLYLSLITFQPKIHNFSIAYLRIMFLDAHAAWVVLGFASRINDQFVRGEFIAK